MAVVCAVLVCICVGRGLRAYPGAGTGLPGIGEGNHVVDVLGFQFSGVYRAGRGKGGATYDIRSTSPGGAVVGTEP